LSYSPKVVVSDQFQTQLPITGHWLLTTILFLRVRCARGTWGRTSSSASDLSRSSCSSRSDSCGFCNRRTPSTTSSDFSMPFQQLLQFYNSKRAK